MKKLLLLVIIIAAVAIGLSWRKSAPAAPQANPSSTTVGGGFQPDASNGTFSFDGEAVTLSGGKNEKTDTLGLTTDTELLSQEAFGDLNGDGQSDAAVLIARSGGGSGTFVYLAAFVSGPVGYKGTDAVFLGDRIAPQSISISHGVITVHFLDRKPDEPFTADPTVPVTKQFVYQNGHLGEH